MPPNTGLLRTGGLIRIACHRAVCGWRLIAAPFSGSLPYCCVVVNAPCSRTPSRWADYILSRQPTSRTFYHRIAFRWGIDLDPLATGGTFRSRCKSTVAPCVVCRRNTVLELPREGTIKMAKWVKVEPIAQRAPELFGLNDARMMMATWVRPAAMPGYMNCSKCRTKVGHWYICKKCSAVACSGCASGRCGQCND